MLGSVAVLGDVDREHPPAADEVEDACGVPEVGPSV
jgi:hypothetical protein